MSRLESIKFLHGESPEPAVEFIHTQHIPRKLEMLDALESARILQSLFRTSQLAELIAVFAHNMQYAYNPETDAFDKPGDIPMNNIDYSILHDSPMLIALGTDRGIVAANMYALNKSALAHERLVPELREPFKGIQVLGPLALESSE